MNQEKKFLNSDTLPGCDCAARIPGILFPTSWDTLGESRDLRVFIVRHDSCEIFADDYSAAQFVSALTGWAIMEIPEQDDPPGVRGRPYFEISLEAADNLVKEFQRMRRC